MSKNNLTANQAAVLTAIREGFHVTDEDFGAVFDTFAADLADRGSIKDKKTAKVVLNQLTKKRLLAVDPETEMLTLTDAGKFAMTEVLFADNPEGLAEQEAHLEQLAERNVDRDFEAATSAAAYEVNVADLGEPIYEEIDGVVTVDTDPIQPGTEIHAIRTETEVTENFSVVTWEDEGKEAPVEWTETTFTDGSKTLKRRQKVSGAWRTDYWGTEADSDKKVFTTAKACKMARAYGSFSSLV